MGVCERLAAAAAVRRSEESGVKIVVEPSPLKIVTRSVMVAAGLEAQKGLAGKKPGVGENGEKDATNGTVAVEDAG
jgi:hypothetical protein